MRETIVTSFSRATRLLPLRKPHSDGAETYRAIRTAAVNLIYQYGFNGTSMRRLAAEVGIDQSTLYYHIKSKQNLLFQIHTDVKEEYLGGLENALSVPDPEERIRRFVRYHVMFRFRLRKMSFITATELRSLTPAGRKILITVQREVLGRLQRTIDQGIAAKVFDVRDSKVAALAIVQLLNGINTWHSPAAGSANMRLSRCIRSSFWGCSVRASCMASSRPQRASMAI